MFAERGAQTEGEVRASLRMIPGLLRIWGGDGEREDPPADDPENKDEDEQEDVDSDDDSEEDQDDTGDKSKKNEKSLEDQLDDERRLRLKAEKALSKKEKAVADAEADKDAVKDRDRYKAKLEARDKFLTENLLVMEIQKQNKFDFVDLDDVVTLIQRKYGDEVTIDLEADVPSVDGLDLALKDIAKKKPHFLKKAKEEEDEEPGPPSGSKAGGGKGGSQDAEDERLAKKFRIPGYGTEQLRAM